GGSFYGGDSPSGDAGVGIFASGGSSTTGGGSLHQGAGGIFVGGVVGTSSEPLPSGGAGLWAVAGGYFTPSGAQAGDGGIFNGGDTTLDSYFPAGDGGV